MTFTVLRASIYIIFINIRFLIHDVIKLLIFTTTLPTYDSYFHFKNIQYKCIYSISFNLYGDVFVLLIAQQEQPH